jgi:hypothetical protein
MYNTKLQIITHLFESRRRLINQLIGDLTIDQVKTDQAFERAKVSVKEQILFETVTIGEPTIMSHRQVEKNYPPNYQNLFGGSKLVNLISVAFPIEGSPELFEHVPEGVRYEAGMVYQPVGRNVTVSVELDSLDKPSALAEANAMMRVTKGIIQANNKQAEEWSQRIEPIIDNQLEQKRKELIDFYS